jgi:uncharacterized membrane protein YuzA (DUF378 family)
MSWYEKTALVLSAIGAINWGLTELGWNAVANTVGLINPILASIVYYVVALCGIWALVAIFKD